MHSSARATAHTAGVPGGEDGGDGRRGCTGGGGRGVGRDLQLGLLQVGRDHLGGQLLQT